jgi:hypothetical protein
MIGFDTYYSRSEVSNSDLSALKNYFMPKDFVMDATAAYRFGNLIDAMITEAHRVDHYRMRVDNEQFNPEEWNKALKMKEAFMKDDFCKGIYSMCSGQSVKVVEDFKINYEGFEFSLPARCKYDLWMDPLKYGADIKSTTATTQKQFEDACIYFGYTRQRAWYMDLTGAEKDILIGISKVNNKIFKIFINKESEFYKIGKADYQYWAFRYWMLFGELKQLSNHA